MKKWCSVLAQAATEGKEPSGIGAIIIGILLLIVIAVILYNRQKRKFND